MFSEKIIDWYRLNKRDLPWRNTKDPYLIWISEVILQQTRVEQGLPYYLRFTERFPTVRHLAEASMDEVLKLWQGLGYYSRARNLHQAATEVVKNYDSVFPISYKELIKLKGVGDYTASAVASFSNKEPCAVLDGNVFRVLARVFNIDLPIDTPEGKRFFKNLAQRLLDKRFIDEYNQAIMEFGALQCKPVSPNCSICILREECLSFRAGKVNLLPKKEKSVKKSERFIFYFVLRKNDEIMLQKRGTGDIWTGMYEFSLLECEEALSIEAAVERWQNNACGLGTDEFNFRVAERHKHILSHQILNIFFIEAEVNAKVIMDGTFWCSQQDLRLYAFPKPIEKYLKKIYSREV